MGSRRMTHMFYRSHTCAQLLSHHGKKKKALKLGSHDSSFLILERQTDHFYTRVSLVKP